MAKNIVDELVERSIELDEMKLELEGAEVEDQAKSAGFRERLKQREREWFQLVKTLEKPREWQLFQDRLANEVEMKYFRPSEDRNSALYILDHTRNIIQHDAELAAERIGREMRSELEREEVDEMKMKLH
jgi:hypothetical protein